MQAEEFMEAVRALDELVVDGRLWPTEILAVEPHGAVASMLVSGTTAEGAEIEFPFVYTAVMDGDRWVALELFDLDKREEALTRLAELRPS
jgi:hypothetical protein